MSLKIKLISCISLFMLMLGLVIVGVFAATQTLSISGNVNFVVADKSLYVKEARIKMNNESNEEPLQNFIPGYINGNINLNVGDITNTSGGFSLYFDIINTSDIAWEISGVEISQELQQQSVGVTYSGSVSVGTTTENTQITEDTPIDGTLVVTITAPNSSSIDLSGITIRVDYKQVKVYEGFEFTINEDNKTASLTGYTGEETKIVVPNSFSIRESDGAYIEGNNYAITKIGEQAFTGDNSLESIDLSGCTNLELIDIEVFAASSIERINLSGCINLNTISISAFETCVNLKSIDLSGCTNLTKIDMNAFYYCSGLESLDLSGCTTLTSIGSFAFFSCDSLTTVTLNEYFYENAVGGTGDGYLLNYATTIKVAESVVNSATASSYISSNFTKGATAVDVFYVFTKNN